MKTNSLLFVLLFLVSTVTYSSQALKLTGSEWWGKSDSSKWQPGPQLDFEAEALLNNYEFSHDDVNGHTQFGWLMPVSVSYTNEEGARMRVGVLVTQQYGDIDNEQSFLGSYQIPFQQHQQLLSFGTLASGHSVHPALLDVNDNLDGRLDQGMEWQTDYSWLTSDLWIDWQSILEQERSEQFEIGWTSTWKFSRLRLHADVIANHVGGEGDRQYTQIRNYGSVVGAGVCLDASGECHYEFGALAINSVYSRDEAKDVSSNGVEVFMQQHGRIAENWQSSLRGRAYIGDPVVTLNGYAGYQMGDFVAADLWFLYTGFQDVQLELGTSLQSTDEGLQTTQTISLNWQFKHPF
ncbi:hypothetical Protein YC6258_04931 [Gynuella sunshinyii YC6258]|uniref:Uncharacterized protein n=1 Tax=Gynuella sunshinyii YC6258 TaxID=1445510 RepID=A0A0C5VUH5_9GAMM|nr:hypothetical Protein YC6258_04931 [Gynuella sunshinyii YC6258]